MIRYRKMEQEDLGVIVQSQTFKPLLQFEPTEKQLFCILGDDDGKIITGLSGVYANHIAAIQQIVLANNEPTVIKEGLIRSTIHILERLGIEYIETTSNEDVFLKIGFEQIDNKTRRISTKEFFKKPGCAGC